jgi:hypothetical protein
LLGIRTQPLIDLAKAFVSKVICSNRDVSNSLLGLEAILFRRKEFAAFGLGIDVEAVEGTVFAATVAGFVELAVGATFVIFVDVSE